MENAIFNEIELDSIVKYSNTIHDSCREYSSQYSSPHYSRIPLVLQVFR